MCINGQFYGLWTLILLSVNFYGSQTKIPLFTNSYYIDDSIIKQVSYCKYLGVTIDEGLTWNNHILTITNKARQVNVFLH